MYRKGYLEVGSRGRALGWEQICWYVLTESQDHAPVLHEIEFGSTSTSDLGSWEVKLMRSEIQGHLCYVAFVDQSGQSGTLSLKAKLNQTCFIKFYFALL